MHATITRFLTDDHTRLDTLLTRAAAGPHFDAESFAQFRAGLLRHIAMEEKVLLKDARARLHGGKLDVARALRMQHAALTSLLVPTPDVALVGEIRALLVEHNALEEGPDGVYALCARLAGVDEAQLVGRMMSIPDVPLMPHADGPRVKRTAREALESAERIRHAR